MFVAHHDTIIYLTVLYFFIFTLIVGVLKIGAHWTTLYQKIDLINDKDVRKWHIERSGIEETDCFEKLTDLAILQNSTKGITRGCSQRAAKTFLL